jgi:hypothetical protein
MYSTTDCAFGYTLTCYLHTRHDSSYFYATSQRTRMIWNISSTVPQIPTLNPTHMFYRHVLCPSSAPLHILASI